MHLQQHLEHLRSLDDEELLRSLKRHVGSESRLNALVLAHLAEVDARGAYRQWACDTLTTYCVYELRLSEDEAQRRCRAARVARQFPVLFAMLAEGSIHLTGILLLAPHLTDENHRDLLARARYRRKREIERLVAELAPARDVPALVELLGPAVGERPARASNTWAAFVEGQAGPVRLLERGDGRAQAPSAPDEWHEDLIARLEAPRPDALEPRPPTERDMERAKHAKVDAGARAPADDQRARTDHNAREPTETSVRTPLADARTHPGASVCAPFEDSRTHTEAPPPASSAPPRALRYRVQFTADQAYVDLLERARDLLWHQLPSGDLAELQRLALQALVEN